ncbi:pygopus homolog 1 [Pocillopora verrucosa]|uniref:PHD-type domain-containing protein n=1 Tax=Pocillopora damicornis TaxID=46731 RepID=A0A3M6UR50_POCDA|nr:pygopus homolog 1-like [Pocillopora damicornis]XP_058945057.1 pygopus homolog 1-like [Pocillopora verrucosa]RMX56079.1 hypothetical protein pdam_00010389 [Pocillopora damicornis]
MPRQRKVPARFRDGANPDEIEAEGESSGSNPESPQKKQGKESSGPSDLVSPVTSMQHFGVPPAFITESNTHPTETTLEINRPSHEIDPVYPCGICKREVNDNDDAIFCETGCAQWYHRVCTGLTELAYDLLTAEENAEWVCDNCIATKSVPLVKLKS